jgi:hypothetical protein
MLSFKEFCEMNEAVNSYQKFENNTGESLSDAITRLWADGGKETLSSSLDTYISDKVLTIDMINTLIVELVHAGVDKNLVSFLKTFVKANK